MTRGAVFLDRDGTVIEERGPFTRVEDVALFPFTIDALRLLKRADFALVLVTNQGAVARGTIEEAFVREVHRVLAVRLGDCARLDGYYFCPHHPDGSLEPYRQACECRKPRPGMIQQACRDLGLDPSRSIMVGDRWTDVASGVAAGTRTVLVRTGHGAAEAAAPPAGARPDAILNNLMEAAGWILRSSSR